MKNKSIVKNTFIYMIRILSSMFFPLITFPYISRVLSPDGVGKYNFSTSVISYFSLLAGLGIGTYAVREGAKVRDDREKLEKIAQELFTINLLSSITSYIIFLFVINIVPNFRENISLLLILSLALPLSTLGTEWIFSIYEDYSYITIRSVSFQIISLILMFLFVKNQKDVNIYASITVFANVGSNIFNYLHAEKYFKHKISLRKRTICHLKPIFILFAAAVASQIYVNSDTVMLGFLKGNYDVGIYAAATKIYNIVRSLLTAFITVITPRLSYYYGKKKENCDYYKLFNSALNMYMAIIVPAAIGIFLVSSQSILLLSGKDYLFATKPLRLLAIALIFSTSGSFVANTVLIVTGQEKNIFIATVVGAIVNLGLNFIFIPLYSYIGAAMTTLLAEFIVFNMQLYFAKTVVKAKTYISSFIKPLIACVPMILFANLLSLMDLNYSIELLLTIIIAIVSYFGVLSIFRHEIISTAKVFVKKSIFLMHIK